MVLRSPWDVVAGLSMTTWVANLLSSHGVFTIYLHVKSGLTTGNTVMARITHMCMGGCTVLRYFVTRRSTLMITEHRRLWMQRSLTLCVWASGLVERPWGLIIRTIIHSESDILVLLCLVDNEKGAPTRSIRRKFKPLALCSSLTPSIVTAEQHYAAPLWSLMKGGAFVLSLLNFYLSIVADSTAPHMKQPRHLFVWQLLWHMHLRQLSFCGSSTPPHNANIYGLGRQDVDGHPIAPRVSPIFLYTTRCIPPIHFLP